MRVNSVRSVSAAKGPLCDDDEAERCGVGGTSLHFVEPCLLSCGAFCLGIKIGYLALRIVSYTINFEPQTALFITQSHHVTSLQQIAVLVRRYDTSDHFSLVR
jgi:hypothetical protein